MVKEGHRQKNMAGVNIYFGRLYQDRTQFSRSKAGKRAKFDNTNNIKEEAVEIEKEENYVTMMFAVIHQQHQDQLNQMK